MDYPKAKVFLALIAGLSAFAFAPILVKLAADYSAFKVAAVRTVFSALILVPVYIASKNRSTEEKHTKGEQKWMALSGVLLGLHFICWIASLYFTSVASASVLVTIHPILLILVERLLFKVRFASTVWTGVIIAFAGSVLLGYADTHAVSDFSNPTLGNGLAVLAAAIFAAYFLIGQKVRRKHSWIGYVFPVYSWAAVTCLLVMFIVDGFSLTADPKLILIGLALAVGPQIMGHGSLNYAVKYVSPTILSTLILTEPLFASILAYFLFDELPERLSVTAMIVILIGVGLTWAKKKARTQSKTL